MSGILRFFRIIFGKTPAQVPEDPGMFLPALVCERCGVRSPERPIPHREGCPTFYDGLESTRFIPSAYIKDGRTGEVFMNWRSSHREVRRYE